MKFNIMLNLKQFKLNILMICFESGEISGVLLTVSNIGMHSDAYDNMNQFDANLV